MKITIETNNGCKVYTNPTEAVAALLDNAIGTPTAVPLHEAEGPALWRIIDPLATPDDPTYAWAIMRNARDMVCFDLDNGRVTTTNEWGACKASMVVGWPLAFRIGGLTESEIESLAGDVDREAIAVVANAVLDRRGWT